MALNARILLFYCVLGQYIHSFVLPEIQEGGATAPLATPLNPPLGKNFIITQSPISTL